jgi:hypothetical protein
MVDPFNETKTPKYGCIRGHFLILAFFLLCLIVRLIPSLHHLYEDYQLLHHSHKAIRRKLLWQGKTWIPTNNRRYTYTEIAEEFRHRCVAFMGDSLTRRLAITVANIVLYHKNINSTHVKPLYHDIEKKIHTSYHWKTSHAKCFDFIWLPTMVNMSNHLRDSRESILKYDTIIFGLAVHDAHMHDVRKVDQKKHRYVTEAQYISDATLNQSAHQLAMDICPYSSNRTIVWRQAPYLWNQNHVNWSLASNARISLINQAIRRGFATCKENVLLLDHEEFLKNVSIGENRIRGNSHEHFGLEARLASVQSLIYDLQKYDAGKKSMLI